MGCYMDRGVGHPSHPPSWPCQSNTCIHTVRSARVLTPYNPQPAHPGMYLSLLNAPPHNLHYLFLTYLTLTPPYPRYTPCHSQPHRFITNNTPPHSIQPPTLDYTATATNTQTTCYYTHITHFILCSQINSSLHFTFALCCRLTLDMVLYSLSPDNGHNDAQNMLS